ncbi:kinesin-like protein KIN-7D, mitochondrial isoform X1 [Andrographis paniculata]|uniref:kinesin-like protein KIN-7D, mitochondrial isoform X1 n=1 Tax=Andrographis paniculata TaxID=175694 RepID=UPI0021E71C1B|nr:kinesin-like protein KIN-7D, mitochondrial isoform X1 [Andrographis paniculata]
MAASSSRGRSSSPFHSRKPTSPYSSTSSSSSMINGRFLPRSCSSSATSFYGGVGGGAVGDGSRSMTPSWNGGDYAVGHTPVSFPAAEDQLVAEPMDEAPRSGDSISVTIRFRPMSDREYHRGDEIAWYADGDKIVRNEYNPMTAYAFDRVFGPDTNTEEVYEVAARPVVKAAMDGINGTVFAYGVTSSGKTHTMHGDQYSPGIIPLAIKDVFSIIQDTPGREFLLRVSYIEIYNEVINDLLDPTGQNLRVREDVQGTYVEGLKEEVVLSPGHALSFIAAGEEHRHVGSNNYNLFSSRSHTIFTLMIESSAHGDEYDGVIFSQLNLIDLAGSESSKTETTGLRRKEGSYINKSLLTLGTVIGKLSEGKASHVPFRDSKLTRLLQSSLSGHGHVSLICTITPASSNLEETHNTLKFASRAKHVEIYASRNRIIDEKSLIKKYQREISCLREELDQFKKGMLVGVNHEEILALRQQLEEGQVKMQSRLEEEEEAKAALMSRIQRLTKLILVSSKNTMPGNLDDVPSHQRSRSAYEEDKLDVLHDGSLKLDGENPLGSSSSALTIPSDVYHFKHRRSSSKWNDDISQAGSTITETTQAGELINGSSCATKLPIDEVTMSDHMDLFVEQVKMLAGEIAFGTSTLKRLVEQSVDDPEIHKTQIQNLELEIQEKRRQMRVLEHRIVEGGEASVANASMVEMQQTISKLMAQCSEKGFELEIKSADNRVLQEQLQTKSTENRELQEKIMCLEEQLASVSGDRKPSLPEKDITDEYIDELRKKIQLQEIENEELKLEHVHIVEENSGLRVQNQKLLEEASYAKELASAAAIELKNLTGEVTKLSLQNAKLAKELQAAREFNSRVPGVLVGNGGARKHNDAQRSIGRRGRISGRANDAADVLDSWNLDPDDLKMELQARKQREAALEAALAERELLEDEYRRKFEESKKRETTLENDLANMWVLVARLKKEATAIQESKLNLMMQNEDADADADTPPIVSDVKVDCTDPPCDQADSTPPSIKETLNQEPASNTPKEEPLVVRLKARMQEIKEKELRYSGNNGSNDANSHMCKVCFESPAAAMLLPCRHFCLCKSCSLACAECPVCRTKIADRIFAFT